MGNLENTKITLNINETLLKQFSDGLDRCYIKRDAFLNNLISIEIDKLAEEMKGVVQSKEARKYLIGNLKRSGTQAINVVVKKTVSERLNRVIKKHSLSRDCFINRLLLLVTLPDGLKEELGMHWHITDVYQDYSPSEKHEISTTTLDGIYSYIRDPFHLLRISSFEDGAVNNLYKTSFYVPRFLKAIEENVKNATSEEEIHSSELIEFMNNYKTMLKVSACYIEDWEIPNSNAYDKEMVNEKNTPHKTFIEILMDQVSERKKGRKDV